MAPEDGEYLTIGDGRRLTIGIDEYLTSGPTEKSRQGIEFNLEFALEWTKEALLLTVRLPFD